MTADPTLPPGFALLRGWAAATPLDRIVGAIAWEQRTIRIFGRTIPQPRMTAWMGEAAYTYSGQRHEPAPLPTAMLADLRERAEAATGARFNSVLANLYRNGADSVAWHADDEPELGPEPTIASLSLGASRAFQIKRNGARHAERVEIVLAHGDLLVMSGASQRDYQHAVPKVRAAVGPRVNLTFRWVG